jgi:Cu(I)/Ag(I) efflux system membrane protein CusA/SilA
MIERVIEVCARNRLLVILAVIVLLAAGLWSMRRVPLDAIPDLTDVQVILYTKWEGRSPDLIEDQVTYPIVSALISAPRVRVVRGLSDFGFSYVYVIFEDGTDLYWARSRVLEYLKQITARLPEGVSPVLGPDATAVGWVFQYALVDETGRHDLSQLRSFQDWTLRYWLASVPGVAEVASVGGFVREYQVQVDPNRLLAYGIPLSEVIGRIRAGNNDVGGRAIESAGTETMVRGRGYLRGVADIERVPVGAVNGTPIRVADVARVPSAPRCAAAWWISTGAARACGVVLMRYGENALNVIRRVKEKIPRCPRASRGHEAGRHLRPRGADHRASARSGARYRGDGHREPRDRGLSVPPAILARPDHRAAHRGRDRVHPHVLLPRHFEHHVARRPGARHRRAGRRGHRDG